jgi:RNA polymerase sigma factor (TIGR02999 family)
MATSLALRNRCVHRRGGTGEVFKGGLCVAGLAAHDGQDGVTLFRSRLLTELLNYRWSTACSDCVYDELRSIARRYLRNERGGITLQTTALVNEVYVRLLGTKGIEWQQRAQFFAIAAQMMRRILIDAAQSRTAHKRGAGAAKLNIEDLVISPERDSSLVALDEALIAFAKIAPRQAKVVELRYFGGMSEEESAHVLKSSTRTVRRDWDSAKTWLTRELSR